MNNNKIGKLIAELRKKKGLTQQDLGDMVGVGFKAVSKWECGTTLPDITIINEVSKILGITTDELLAGELNKPEEVIEEKIEEPNNDKKKKTKLIITISILTILLVFITSIFIYQNSNKTYTYNLVSIDNSDYYVSGKIYLNKKNISLAISKLHFEDEELINKVIKNYEYMITINKKMLFGYGYIDSIISLEEIVDIEEFAKNFKIDFEVKKNISNKEFIENNIVIEFKFLTNDNEIIIKRIYMKLEKTK